MAARKKTQAKKKAPAKKKKQPAKVAMVSGPSTAQEKKWQAEDDMHVLMRAEEVKSDRKRMIAAKNMAKQKAKEAAAVAAKIK
jgi:hypothetical protein